MDCSPSRNPEAGYATPAAMVFCIAVTLVASAVLARSVTELRMARADFDRTVVEFGLDGAHLQAAAAVVRAGDGGPYRWAFSTDVGWVTAIAESEVEKLAPASAAGLPDEVMIALGVKDAPQLRARLRDAEPFADVPALDESAVWKRCVPRLMSGFGRAESLSTQAAGEPRPSVDPAWRVGEVWQFRLTTATGWRDDRIVRFTGDAQHPVAVVRRRLSRSDRGEQQCDEIVAAARAAQTVTP